MASPTCLVKQGAGAFMSVANGFDATPAATVVIGLESTADVSAWSIACITTDGTAAAATINAGLVIDSVAKTATFTAPAAGQALRFRSTVNGGRDRNNVEQEAYSTTFCVYTLTAESKRVHALDETYESNALYGWAADLNDVIRNAGGGGATPTGTGLRHVTGGVEDAAAVLISDGHIDDLAQIAAWKLAPGPALTVLIGGLPNEFGKIVDGHIDPTAAIAASKLAAGSEGQVLTTSAGVAAWTSSSSPALTHWSPVDFAAAAASPKPTWGAGNFTAGLSIAPLGSGIAITGIRIWAGFAGSKNLKFSVWNPAGTLVVAETEAVTGTSGVVHTHTFASAIAIPVAVVSQPNTWTIGVYDTSGSHYCQASVVGGIPPLPQWLWQYGTKRVAAHLMMHGTGDSRPASGTFTGASGSLYMVEPVFA